MRFANNGVAFVYGSARRSRQTDPPPPPPNCFTDACPPPAPEFVPDCPKEPCAYHPRWELDSEMVYFLFRRPNPGFPLVTSGNINDAIPGAIGEPGTTIIADGNSFTAPLHIGTKVTATYWCGENPEEIGIQGSFFIMEMAATTFSASNQGGPNDPVLARPYFNAGLGLEDSDPRAVPGLMSGSTRLGFYTRLMGADASALYNLTGYSRFGPSIYFLAGPRVLRFQERFSSNDTASDLPPTPGNNFVIQDNFTTDNLFYGGQIGTQLRYRLERVTIDLVTKLAVGINHETLNIGGFTSVTDQATGQTVSAAQGLFAQPSNIGTYTRNVVSVIPEIGVKLHVDLTDTIKVTLGYGFMTMNRVARPEDQINRTVNIQPLGAPAQVGPAFPQRPTTIYESNFWTHYFGIGIELVF